MKFRGTTVLLNDGSIIIGEATNTGKMIDYYTPGINIICTMNGYSFSYQENALGSTLALTGGSGSQHTRYEYDAYGITYTLLSSTNQPFKFAGKHGYYNDSESGMLLLGHRYYLPSLGRFLTQDPEGHDAGLNLYEYCGNNPLTSFDDDGEDIKSVATAVGNAFAAPFMGLEHAGGRVRRQDGPESCHLE